MMLTPPIPTAAVSVKAKFFEAFLDMDRLNAWLATLPLASATGCATPGCEHGPDDWYLVTWPTQGWDGVALNEERDMYLYERGWDAHGDGADSMFILCEGCMSAYAIPEGVEWR